MFSCHDRITKCLRQCQRTVLKTSLPKAAVLLLLVEKAQSLHIVLTHRARHLKLHAGEVAFPGGKQDAQDESLLATALRESHEEISLPRDRIQILGQCSDIISITGIQVTPFVGIMDSNVSLVPNKAEIDSIFTVPVSFFMESPCERLTIKRLGREVVVPCFHFGHHKIWGLTAFILVEFINMAYNAKLTGFKPIVSLPEQELHP